MTSTARRRTRNLTGTTNKPRLHSSSNGATPTRPNTGSDASRSVISSLQSSRQASSRRTNSARSEFSRPNTSQTPDSDRRYRAFKPPSHSLDPEKRKNMTATWGGNPAPSHREWQTETESLNNAVKLELEPHTQTLDLAAKKLKYIESERNKKTIAHVRDKLAALAVEKYGSVTEMFREFDDNKDGELSLEEFSQALSKRHLEKLFPRTDQRIIFKHIDADFSDSVALDEFQGFMDSAVGENYDLFTKTLPPNTEPVKKLSASLTATKDKIVAGIFERNNQMKLPDGGDSAKETVIRAFKHFDKDMSGSLDRQEIIRALGPEHLNLKISDQEVLGLVEAMDENSDNSVSYREFTDFLDIHDIDPAYNLMFESRDKQLKRLRHLAAVDRKDDDAEMRESMRKVQEIREAVGIAQHSTPVTDSTHQEMKGSLRQPKFPYAKPDETFESRSRRLCRPVKASDNLTPSMAHSTRMADTLNSTLSSSQDLFESMNQSRNESLSSIIPRGKCYAVPVNFKRIGYGGDSIPSTSALYLQPEDQYVSTNKAHFGEIIQKPNQPPRREGLSDLEKSQQAGHARLKHLRKQKKCHDDRTAAISKANDIFDDLNEKQRLKNTSLHLMRYFEQTYDQDRRKHLRDNATAKRRVPSVSNRMWNGSEDNQFHHDRRREGWRGKDEFKTEIGKVGTKDNVGQFPNFSLGRYLSGTVTHDQYAAGLNKKNNFVMTEQGPRKMNQKTTRIGI